MTGQVAWQVARIRGFTLVELMITVMVAAVGLTLAIPSFENIAQRRHNTAKAEGLAVFLARARSEAIKANREVVVAMTYTSETDWCIGAKEGITPCDCYEDDPSDADFCDVDVNVTDNVPGTELRVDGSTFSKSLLKSFTSDAAAGAGGFVFDPLRGIKSSVDLASNPVHSFILQSENDNWALEVDIGPAGRVRVCIPSEDALSDAFLATPGYKLCASPVDPG